MSFNLSNKVQAFKFIFRLYNFISSMEDLSNDFSPDSCIVTKFILNWIRPRPTLPQNTLHTGSKGGSKKGPKSGSKVGTQAQTTQAASGLSISGGHAWALLQMEGYTLLPEDSRQPGQSTIARAVRFGYVVALKLLRGSGATNELDILKYLQTFDSQENHTIKLLDVLHSDAITGDIIVMPWQSPLNVFLDERSDILPNVVELLQNQFLEGVWFLHERGIAHLDLKPENVLLGYTDSSPLPRLSIIDFGISVRVESEETMVEGFRGTPFWSAPEVGSDCGPTMKYSAILADRWSCGQMILYIAQPHPVNDASVFVSTYSKLLSSDPSSRPPLGKVLDSLRAVGAVKRIGDTDKGFMRVQHVQKRPRTSACWYVCSFCHVPSLRLMYRLGEQPILD